MCARQEEHVSAKIKNAYEDMQMSAKKGKQLLNNQRVIPTRGSKTRNSRLSDVIFANNTLSADALCLLDTEGQSVSGAIREAIDTFD